jgi:putative heme-binding domain-containing protein
MCAVSHGRRPEPKSGIEFFTIGDLFPRRELVAAMLKPSATVAVGYGATLVEPTSGETLLGVVKQADHIATVFMGPDSRAVRVLAADIKTQRISRVSLRPKDVHSALSLQEFADVVEFLASLEQPKNSLRPHQGMPAEIAQRHAGRHAAPALR